MRKLLIHAAEECGELVQAAMKKARGDWSLKNLTDEAADVAAFLIVLQERGAIDTPRYEARLAVKLKKMRRKYGS